MRVDALMQTQVQTVPWDAVANDVVLVLAESRISALPVVDGTGSMVGVISRTDVLAPEEEVEDQSARDVLLAKTFVRDLMTPALLTIGPDADVKEAVRRMLYEGVHQLFVSEGRRLLGVISTTDVLRAVVTGTALV
jgi:CBS-domain-containing membrane protein